MINSKYMLITPHYVKGGSQTIVNSEPVDKMLICLCQFKMKSGSCILRQIRPPPCNIGWGRGGNPDKFIERISLKFQPILSRILLTVLSTIVALSVFTPDKLKKCLTTVASVEVHILVEHDGVHNAVACWQEPAGGGGRGHHSSEGF